VKFKQRKLKHAFLLSILITLSGLSIHSVCRAQEQPVKAGQTQYLYLSGQGKDDAVEWDFLCTAGRNSCNWAKIPVPSQWELQRFGTYNYGHDKNKANEQGKYKHAFTVPASWKSRNILIVFEGSMTDTEVFINGKSTGPIHQGGFYRFSYDITELIRIGSSNVIEVTVSKVSSNAGIEEAERQGDYWVFGGIYRPVYLAAFPSEYIDWTSVDAAADGTFLLDVYIQYIENADRVVARIYDLDGKPLGEEFSAVVDGSRNKVRLFTKIMGHKPWTSESPNLYNVRIELRNGKELIHTVTKRFGFRTFQVRPGEGLFLNGTKITLKGVNRHCSWPDSGRCLSRKISYDDVRLIKQMNMNAVRMSHYPPDTHFLEACDELGLYVLDELAGWQKPSYDTKSAKRLIEQMVKRDQMHPCILFWDNANEGGWNREADGDFGLYDLQKRPVLHPWELFSGVDTEHYKTYDILREKLQSGNIFMPTEFLHGLYDGGHGAGLNDYWKLMQESELAAGGFLWVFADEGIVRTDRNGRIDVDGNHAPDGIVGPYRQKEGSFYTIREIWSPVQIATEKLPLDFDGSFEVRNCYDFTNLDKCSFKWQLVDFPSPFHRKSSRTIVRSGKFAAPSIAPGNKGLIRIDLPRNWRDSDALYLTAFDWNSHALWKWTWNITTPADYRKRITNGNKNQIQTREQVGTIIVSTGDLTVNFDKSTGLLREVKKGQNKFSFANGPRCVPKLTDGSINQLPKVEWHKQQNRAVLEVTNPGSGLETLTWKVCSDGWLELSCAYYRDGRFDFHGITFDYPEHLIRAKKWLGDGPYRVWKNRMKGTQFDVWQCDYNDTEQGRSWDYPEFKGYFSNINWLALDTLEGIITIATDTPGLFLRLYTPRSGREPKNTAVTFPAGDISFLHAVGPIGTKFHPAKNLGPESRKTIAKGIYKITLYFFFGDRK
jgi:hypothetical protein